jgi:phage terminase large subunit-like protein
VRQDHELSLAEKIAKLSQAERDAVFAGYTQADFDSLDFDWGFWGRPEQLAPPGTWDNWLILAGRGFGKTRTGAEWVRANMCGDTPLTGGR